MRIFKTLGFICWDLLIHLIKVLKFLPIKILSILKLILFLYPQSHTLLSLSLETAFLAFFCGESVNQPPVTLVVKSNKPSTWSISRTLFTNTNKITLQLMCPPQKTLRKNWINKFVLQLWMSTNLGFVGLREKKQTQVLLPSALLIKLRLLLSIWPLKKNKNEQQDFLRKRMETIKNFTDQKQCFNLYSEGPCTKWRDNLLKWQPCLYNLSWRRPPKFHQIAHCETGIATATSAEIQHRSNSSFCSGRFLFLSCSSPLHHLNSQNSKDSASSWIWVKNHSWDEAKSSDLHRGVNVFL